MMVAFFLGFFLAYANDNANWLIMSVAALIFFMAG